MAFKRRHLSEGEEVVLETRPHWSYLGWAPAEVLVLVGGLVAVVVVWPQAPLSVGWALLGVVGLAVLWLARRVVRWRSTVLVITTSRLLQRTGLLARRGVDVRLERVNEISYEQSIPERLIGTGRLYLDVGGDRGTVGFEHVRRPRALAAVLHEQVDRRSSAAPGGSAAAPGAPWAAGPGAGPGSPWSSSPAPPPLSPDDTPPRGTSLAPGSVAQQLIELDELRRRGILNEAEYAERRARLLDRL